MNGGHGSDMAGYIESRQMQGDDPGDMADKKNTEKERYLS